MAQHKNVANTRYQNLISKLFMTFCFVRNLTTNGPETSTERLYYIHILVTVRRYSRNGQQTIKMQQTQGYQTLNLKIVYDILFVKNLTTNAGELLYYIDLYSQRVQGFMYTVYSANTHRCMGKNPN